MDKVADRFKILDSLRDSKLQRARFCSSLTVPSILPPDNWTEQDQLPQPYSSVSARGVTAMASRMLSALLPLNDMPFFKFDLASGVTAEPEINDYLENLSRENLVHKTYINDTNIKKYPAMRQMFYDMEDPITDKYVIWFDDDSIADKDTQWFTKLCTVIKNNHAENYRYYGAKFFWNLNYPQIQWIKSRPWYRNRGFQMKNGLESPNANKVMFATGGFWAAEMEAIRGAGVPDDQIGHNGGDYMIGEQLWQYGVNLKEWNRDKMFVTTSSVPRRGLNEVHTGQNGWMPGGVPQ